jgi:uncharacterized protein DUF2865
MPPYRADLFQAEAGKSIRLLPNDDLTLRCSLASWRRNGHMKWRRAILAGALSTVAIAAALEPVRAEGFMDFLFGGNQQRQALPPTVSSYAAPPPAAAPHVPAVSAAPHPIAGRSLAFCVRLCDGRSFPLEHVANATPIETCQAMCPASKTKVFFGSEINHAVARDGARYAALDNAYVYRDHLVTNCTCNGKDALGLARIDVKSDSTLRRGDLVSTRDGLVAYDGERGQPRTFTPAHVTAAADPQTLTRPPLQAR